MVWGAIFGTILRSKSNLKIDKQNQSDFGLILEGFRVQFGSMLAPKIDQKSRSIFEGKKSWIMGVTLGVQGYRRGPS